jgi:hypothetical protein
MKTTLRKVFSPTGCRCWHTLLSTHGTWGGGVPLCGYGNVKEHTILILGGEYVNTFLTK